MQKSVLFNDVLAFLDAGGAAYRLVRHEPTRTSEESARARGEPLSIGGKALLIRVGGTFSLFALSAALKVDSRRIKEHFGAKESRFATREELMELTGLVPGTVPPFGRPILPFDLYADESIPANDRIAFNAASSTDSIVMAVEDYLRLAKPRVFSFAR